MKIEKVNDHQIRCTLTKDDLADRELKISELAYGTEKAKNLFRDMMRMASLEYGFEAEDIPLMIEAIPINGDCIVLVITKVEDPEELDTRFSKFAPSVHDEDESDSIDETITNLSGAEDDVLDLFRKIKKDFSKDTDSKNSNVVAKSGNETEPAPNESVVKNLTKIFSFASMNELLKPAGILKTVYDGENSLYKNTKTGRYLLVIHKSTQSPESFNKVCNILSEYGKLEKSTVASECYFIEHYDLIIEKKALQSLALVLQ